MNIKFLCSFLLFFAISCSVYSQTIYHFEYNFPAPNDSKYSAFFVRYDNGSGFVRLLQQAPGNETLVEMQVQEQYVSDKEANIDTNRIFYQATNAQLIRGNSVTGITAPVFWFNKNPSSGLFEPAAVTTSAESSESGQGSLSKATLIKAGDLKQPFVKQYFKEEEDFYTNLFELKPRGSSDIDRTIKLYLLVVANTNDSSIGVSCYKDMNRMVETFQDLTDYLGIGFYPITIYGKSYNKKAIQDSIKKLQPSSKDIVVFYYTGHGFRKAGDKRRFPYLDFREKPRDDYKVYSMNVEDIFLTISKKPSRFNLVLSDCCNNDPSSTNVQGTPVATGRGAGLDWNEDNVKALFLNPNKMSILATAADIGQLASSNNNFGGFFSYFFKSSMENHFSVFKKNVTWEQVMEDAQKQTIYKADHTYCSKPYIPANICKQYPFYRKLPSE